LAVVTDVGRGAAVAAGAGTAVKAVSRGIGLVRASRVAEQGLASATVGRQATAGTRVSQQVALAESKQPSWIEELYAQKARLGDDPTWGGGPVTKAYHHTFEGAVESIMKKGLKEGSYATPTAGLTPIQAQIELALPPNRGLPEVVIEIDVDALRGAGYEIPSVTRVTNVVPTNHGRVYTQPGGGYQMQFPYKIRPKYLRVIP